MGMFDEFVKNTTGSASDAVSNTAGSVGDFVGNTVGSVGDFVKNTGSSLSDILGNIDLSDPATIAAIGLAVYGYYNPELFGLGAAEGGEALSGLDVGGAGAGGDTWGTLGSTSGGQASNAVATTAAVDSAAPTATSAAAPVAETSTAAPTASSGTGLQSSGSLGAQGQVSTFPSASTNFGYGTGGEGLTMPTTEAAATTPNAAWSESIAPADNAPWTLGDLGSSIKGGAQSLGKTIMDNKLATAMIGSSLYDMYAKKKMANELEHQKDMQAAQINNMYAPGSPEYNALMEQARRSAVAAGRPIDSSQFSADIAAKIADRKLTAAQNNNTSSNALLAGQLGNQYGGLNTMFNNMALYTMLQKKGLA